MLGCQETDMSVIVEQVAARPAATRFLTTAPDALGFIPAKRAALGITASRTAET